MTVGAIMCSRP
jgi:RHS repeat-associated protein